jgi:5,10-methylenetetrahydromethanopterin reductase
MLMGDNQCLVGDCFVGLALAARATSTIKLGIGVTNPVTRHPSVTAAAAGLLELSDGRMVLGIGRGDSLLAHVGVAPSSLARIEGFVRNVQTYLRGAGVPLDDLDLDRTGQRLAGELGAAGVPEDSRLVWLDRQRPKVPVDIAASGPAVISIAARHGDRVTFGVGADPARLAWAIDTARTARAEAGLDPDALQLGAYVNLVGHPDEEVALELAATGVVTFSRFSIMHGKTVGPVSDQAQEALQGVAQTYDLREHVNGDAKHRGAVDADYITTFGVVGTPEHCVQRLVELHELGLDRVVVLGAIAGSAPPSACRRAEPL